ncbi:DUF2336 domain-containing protein [Siccirubricoccus sp. KC 17139]|uniref:DUF2336 domain-containing protein n=1 Tax=Siccirubricoccus soli TaxID=2899147 RepID=A0ABT1D7H4_9PROT|nr:DUF2336 domain-containing protein [Siccirubricoccus soli]MCO6417890.1 DUF2336 domain-containing protein [Siccirubricoccus soli]MCP2684025.1 DUF2336 domain-containing protein [Siccirubricoccus soli]
MSSTQSPPAVSDSAKRIAAAGSEAERVALAAQRDAAPEILYFLASDRAVAVRAAVAGNGATPVQAERLLAADQAPEVRAALGRKLAPCAYSLSAAADRRGQQRWQTLQALVADAAVAVRAVLAEELKSLPDAPRELILRLAQDMAMEVAEPVILASPLLTEEDLLALVAAPPVPETLTAIARRPALSERLSEAIIETGAAQPVAALLDNPSANIREAALDRVILGAARHLSWQESLVRRPLLPPAAARRLAACLAEHLLEALAARQDLDAGLAQELRERVERRLDREAAAELPPELAFENAGMQGDRGAMSAALARAAGLGEAAVQRAVRLRSAKGLVSLCWKAGFTARSATLAQTVLGQLSPSAALPPKPDGGWPLTESEMAWQLELLIEEDAAS